MWKRSPLLRLNACPFFLQWLRNPGPQHEKRTLFGDMVCFLFITPLATISGWLCLRGAVDHLHFSSRLEAVGLIALTVALFTIYLFWTLVSICFVCVTLTEIQEWSFLTLWCVQGSPCDYVLSRGDSHLDLLPFLEWSKISNLLLAERKMEGLNWHEQK